MSGTIDGRKGSKSSFPNNKLGHPMDFKHSEHAPFVWYGQSRWSWCGA
jgi:hypothetical protein